MRGYTRFAFKVTAVFLLILQILFFALGVPAYADKNSVPPEVDIIMLLRDYIRDNHVADINDMDLLRGAINGMMEALNDPYSTYFTPEEFHDFNDSTSGNFGGIGVVITTKDKLTTVVSVLPGTPAEKAGLKPNDRIVQINDINVREASISEIQKQLKGTAGTQVDIGVIRDGENKVLKFSLTRDNIKVNPIESRILDKGIAYLKINEFNENTVINLDVVLDYFRVCGVAGIVLDLRNNPGGFLDQAIDAASYFVPKGPVVNLVEKDGTTQTFSADSDPYPFKLVVLVNGGSASASEILAGAIKDRGAGIIIGEQTFGKATVQKTLNLGSIGGIKLTVARYTTPNGTDINKVGITPDIKVEDADKNLAKDLLPISTENSLRYGSVGLDVMGVQQRLALLKMFTVTPDGVYGPLTEKAVKEFQAKKGIAVTGAAEADLFELLDEAVAEYINGKEDPQLRRAIDVLLEQLKIRSKAS